MKIAVLGCGSSVGVPSVGCDCCVCRSSDIRNKRTRTSALVEKGQTRVLIDTSPDLRVQALRQNFCTVDAVLFTHCHADHSAGIAELQAFVPKSGHAIPVYSDFGTMGLLISSNSYLFIPSDRQGAPWKRCHYLIANTVRHNVGFRVGELGVVAIRQHHGEINSNGFIFDDALAYCTDVKGFPSESWEMLIGKKMLILGCLRYESGNAHAHVDLCAEWIKELKPEVAVLTHMSHDIDYDEVQVYMRDRLPGQKIVVAYDGLELIV